MDMQFCSTDPEGALWHQRVQARMRPALRRMHGAVEEVCVHLDVINKPDGGADKCCRVEVAVVGQEPVAVTATAHSWHASIDAATTVLRQRLISRRAREPQGGLAESLLHTPRPSVSPAPFRQQAAGG